MKKTLLIIAIFTISTWCKAQGTFTYIPTIYVNKDITLLLVNNEKISLVDISTNNVAGNTPLDNLVRLKPIKEFEDEEEIGVVTIIGERNLSQYRLIYLQKGDIPTSRYIHDKEQMPMINPLVEVPTEDITHYSNEIYKSRKSFFNVSTKLHKMKLTLNNLYSYRGLFFIDLEIENYSNINFDIDDIVFKIEDKKKIKSTNVQELKIEPIYQHQNINSFKKKYRNIFVFKKFTIPNDKTFSVIFIEKEISGRYIKLDIDYSDILNADTL